MVVRRPQLGGDRAEGSIPMMSLTGSAYLYRPDALEVDEAYVMIGDFLTP